MNSSGGERGEPSSEGESSRGVETVAVSSESKPDICASTSDSPQDNMKRAAARRLIERYFYQLVDGCGNAHCDNRDCASSGETGNLTPNEAAAEAIRLFYKDAKLCDRQNCLPSKVPRTETGSTSMNDPCASKTENSHNTQSVQSKAENSTQPSHSSSEPHTSQLCHQPSPNNNNGVPLTEERLSQLCKECLETEISQPLVRVLGETLCEPALLARCFPAKNECEDVTKSKKKSDLDKESRSSSSDPDKDVDSIAGPVLDIASCKRAFKCLATLPSHYYEDTLLTAVVLLSEALKFDMRVTKKLSVDDTVNCIVIAFEIPIYISDVALCALCEAVSHMTVPAQAKLARTWALHCQDKLPTVLISLQQMITLKVYAINYDCGLYVQDNEHVVNGTKLMKIVYYASILAGEIEPNARKEEPVVLPPDPLGDAIDLIYPMKQYKNQVSPDPLGLELQVCALDCRKPLLPFEDFYNEPLCDYVEMDRDFSIYKTEISSSSAKPFAFLHYPFILTAATKALGLYYDNRIRMYSERRASIFHAVVGSSLPVPYLRLKVRRTHIIEDALVELELIALERALDLKKQLVVEFEGEQGVDEGGVSKEFFQLVVEEVFNPDYGMFTHQSDSGTVWFNPMSFETEAQFTLIGIVLGLAIYNNVILAVNFPMVLYRKLLGRKGSFEDLSDWNPVLYRSLRSMLEHRGDDMAEVYVQTFRVCCQDMFGNPVHHDLKRDGDAVYVDQGNKQEFVDLYADLLLNKSVASQFGAFRRGFAMVTDESPLAALFRPEELETLVCGSKNFDFNELEKSTEYEGGYTAESPIIRHFWTIVHSISIEDKRRLLQFATGSDRVPVGGLRHLKLVIARNGPDTDRLPTAHTCFNVLLLPEYDSRDKLNDRLMKAISYSKGFGML